jgi:RNase P protein component
MSERKITQIKRAFFLSLLIISLSAAGAAQTVTGTIKGIVVDTADASCTGRFYRNSQCRNRIKRNLETAMTEHIKQLFCRSADIRFRRARAVSELSFAKISKLR